jgi:hypothetical protein
MDMLHRGNNILIILCLIISFVSCSRYKKYNAKEVNEICNRSIAKSQCIIGQDEYWGIYNKINDSIDSWVENKLGNYAYWTSIINYQVDSVLCVNEEQNKIITSILLPCVSKECLSDEIKYFYGVKIKEEWYFFGGSTMHISREYYQKDIHTPLSFEKLKQIATSNIYRQYLVKNRNGDWEINDRFFENLSKYDAYSRPFTTQESYDESWLQLMRENWNKRDKR